MQRMVVDTNLQMDSPTDVSSYGINRTEVLAETGTAILSSMEHTPMQPEVAAIYETWQN